MGNALTSAVNAPNLIDESQPASMANATNRSGSTATVGRSQSLGGTPAAPLSNSLYGTPPSANNSSVQFVGVGVGQRSPGGAVAVVSRPGTPGSPAAGRSMVPINVSSPGSPQQSPPARPVRVHRSRHEQSLDVRSEKTYLEFVELSRHMGIAPLVTWLQKKMTEKLNERTEASPMDYPFVKGPQLVAMLEPQRGKTLAGSANTQCVRSRAKPRTARQIDEHRRMQQPWEIPDTRTVSRVLQAR